MINVIVKAELDSGSAIMSDETFRELGSPDGFSLHFGQFQRSMAIILDNTREAGEILIPARLTEYFTIPDLPYEAKWDGRDLHLGPVIGFMNPLRFFLEPRLIATRFAKYSEVKGLIFIFSNRQVDIRRKLIIGKYYKPQTDSFVEAVVPYPSVVYLRTNPKPEIYHDLKAHLGAGHIYNYPFRSNKWVFWRLAKEDPEVRRHLPETSGRVTARGVLDMLRKYGAVYLKPYNWSRGRGIFRLGVEGRLIVLSDPAGNKWIARDINSLEELLRMKLRRNYLMQQEIPYKYQGHKIDFRIYLQKNSAREWVYRWMDTKVAQADSIISNFSNRLVIVPGEEGLQTFIGLNKEEAQQKIAEITQVCSRALKPLEDNGHSLGDVAVDFVLDQNKKVWILEVQPDYFGDVFRLDYQAQYMHYHCFDYARTLAGF